MCQRLVTTVLALVVVVWAGGCVQLGVLGPGRIREVRVERSPRRFEFNRIALIDVDGFIWSSSGRFLSLAGTTVAEVKEKLNRAAGDRSVRAVVLRINSPGGEAAASDMIYEEVLAFKGKTGKPVVAALMGMATSGGYYVALGADRIVAAPTSVTGSVGVLMRFFNVEGLYGKIGLREEVIKSGDKKDIGSAVRPVTAAERRILREVNRALFDRFMEAVRTRRTDMTTDDVAVISDGRIVTAEQAKVLHMVDEVGYLDDAIAEARRLAGVATAEVFVYRAFPKYNSNIYAQQGTRVDLLQEGLDLLLRRRGPMFMYLWAPGN